MFGVIEKNKKQRDIKVLMATIASNTLTKTVRDQSYR